MMPRPTKHWPVAFDEKELEMLQQHAEQMTRQMKSWAPWRKLGPVLAWATIEKKLRHALEELKKRNAT